MSAVHDVGKIVLKKGKKGLEIGFYRLYAPPTFDKFSGK